MAENTLLYLFDGAMGTYLSDRYSTEVSRSEFNNLKYPERVLGVHREYIEAGATAIKTNTFSANTASLGVSREEADEIIARGCAIALKAAQGTNATVFASIGPVSMQQEEREWEEYCSIIMTVLQSGVRHFLFETFHEYRVLLRLADEVKRCCPEAYIIAECTVTVDGYTTSGIPAAEIVAALRGADAVDAYGFNCTCGPMHLLHIAQRMDIGPKPVSIMPNAGYPTLIGCRTVFENAPAYFAGQMAAIQQSGVRILGGCCGTTPEHIRITADALNGKRLELDRKKKGTVSVQGGKSPLKPATERPQTASGGKRFAVELDSPMDANPEKFVQAARDIWDKGVNMLTIADCPVARARVDSSMLAALLKHRYGIDVMPHLTCRDRNLNATKALLLGLGIESIDKVLVVTGDPIAAEDRGKVKGVFNFNSEKLIAFIRDLNRGALADCPIQPAAALNVNTVNFEAELERAKRKEQAGAVRFFTQPVFTEESCRNLERARAELSAELFGGIMPLVSYRNACFVNNEVSGITIPQETVDRYEGKNREQAERLAILLSVQTAKRISAAVDGYYLITPFQRAGLIGSIIDAIKEDFSC